MSFDGVQAQAFRFQLDELALDVGRLRPRLKIDQYGEHLLGRIARRVAILDSLVQPTAAELVQASVDAGADIDQAVEAALADIEAHTRRLRQTLRESPPLSEILAAVWDDEPSLDDEPAPVDEPSLDVDPGPDATRPLPEESVRG